MPFFNKFKRKVQKVALKSYRPFFLFGILYFTVNYLHQIILVSMLNFSYSIEFYRILFMFKI